MIKKTAVALAMPLVVVLALVTRNEAQQPATVSQIGLFRQEVTRHL